MTVYMVYNIPYIYKISTAYIVYNIPYIDKIRTVNTVHNIPYIYKISIVYTACNKPLHFQADPHCRMCWSPPEPESHVQDPRRRTRPKP